jgi:DNA-binding HxlR family transcriptional regulator
LEIAGDKWSMLIIRDIAFEGKRHFRELLHSEERIASNILTDRLNMLECNGLLNKEADPSHKQKYIYSLTEKSIDLLPLLAEITKWSLKYEPVDTIKYRYSVEIIKGGDKVLTEVRARLVKDHLM